jgi:sulfite reductase (ferredoxin)
VSATWKDALRDRIPPILRDEIDAYDDLIALRRRGKVDERVFQESRLRRGVYGQRYDNGQRHDGEKTQTIPYPAAETKGVHTLWDAPGMQRIKIPFGGLTPAQMDVLADVAEEYGDAILHVTTRQDFQIHFVQLDDTPDLMRRLAAAGITTREACGNTVRNVTACPVAGVCGTETFDVTPYAKAVSRFLLGHRDAQDFGRKFKVAFSGCAEKACGLARMHDLGFIAKIRDGRRGFQVLVGGGLGPIPYQAQVLAEWAGEDEICAISQAVARVFARLGEKKNRNRARIKFLVAKLGIDEFRRLVEEERKGLPADPAWTDWIDGARAYAETPRPPAAPSAAAPADGFDAWKTTNVYRQRQAGYVTVTVTLPLGDITADQARRLADIALRFVGVDAALDGSKGLTGGTGIRTTVEQNIVLRWVREADLPALHADLVSTGLGEAGAESIVDVTACPGTDTCKLGIASSRGLAAVLRERLAARNLHLDAGVRDIRIKVSGCFNSCGQHHVADLGFYGSSRTIGGYTVPHFQVLLGGAWAGNAESYGLSIGTIPSRRIPDVVDRFIDRYARERRNGEPFRAWIGRIGKKEAKAMVDEFAAVPAHEADASFYSDWGDPREYTIGDIGKGECAGAVVSPAEFALAAAEREVFEAHLALDDADAATAAGRAYRAMHLAAQGLVRDEHPDVGDDPAEVVAAFRARFYDTELFFDPFAGGRFAAYYFAAHERVGKGSSFRGADLRADEARRLVEEAQLFIDAAHACRRRVLERRAALPSTTVAPTA